MKRLLTYLKPHIFAMIVSLILTLFIIVLEDLLKDNFRKTRFVQRVHEPVFGFC